MPPLPPDDERFVAELEFVSALASPAYIHHLAQQKYLEDEAFVAFLKYLQYWQTPPYVQYVQHPHALAFLDLLQRAPFRRAMAAAPVKNAVHQQQFHAWMFHRDNLARAAYGLEEATEAGPKEEAGAI